MLDKWTLIHRYNRLVRRGEATALACPDCGEQISILINEQEEPGFWCGFEDCFFAPGTRFWEDIGTSVAKYDIW